MTTSPNASSTDAIPKARLGLAAFGAVIAGTGLGGLMVQKRLQRQLLEAVAGNDAATRLVAWVTTPEVAGGLLATGILLMLLALIGAKQPRT